MKLINETPDTVIDIIEPVLLTNLSEGLVGSSKPSEILPILCLVNVDLGLNLSRKENYDTTYSHLIKQIKNN